MKLVLFEDENIKLCVDENDEEKMEIELYNQPSLSDVKASVRKWRAIESFMNNLIDAEEDCDDE